MSATSGIKYLKTNFALITAGQIPVGSYLVGFDVNNGGKLSKMDSALSLTVIETGGTVTSVVAGTNVSVDNTDPANPIVSSTNYFTEGLDFTFLTSLIDHFLIGSNTDVDAKVFISGYDRLADFALLINDGTDNIFRIGSTAAGFGKLELLNGATSIVQFNSQTNTINYINNGIGAGSHFIVGAAASSGDGAQMEVKFDRAVQYGLQVQDTTGVIAYFHSTAPGKGTLFLTDNNVRKTAISGDSAQPTYFNSGSPVVVGATTADTSALLEVASTTQGFLLPRMTTTQRDAIASPAAGLTIFNTTLGKINVFTTGWETVTSI